LTLPICIQYPRSKRRILAAAKGTVSSCWAARRTRRPRVAPCFRASIKRQRGENGINAMGIRRKAPKKKRAGTRRDRNLRGQGANGEFSGDWQEYGGRK